MTITNQHMARVYMAEARRRHQNHAQRDYVSALVEALVDARAFTLEHDSGRSGVVRGRIDAALARAKGVLG